MDYSNENEYIKIRLVEITKVRETKKGGREETKRDH